MGVHRTHTPALTAYEFSGSRRVVDIGGSTGQLVSELLAVYPDLTAVLFDQPHVVAGAKKQLESAGVMHRCEIVAGDFFDAVPQNGDLYILSRVLLNWDDEHALKILSRCREAMSPGAKLLIMDFILPNEGRTASELLASLHLLVLGGRLLRTEDEYYSLLSAVGFEEAKLIKWNSTISFIESTAK